MTSDWERKVAKDDGSLVEYHADGMLEEYQDIRISGYRLKCAVSCTNLPSGSPKPGTIYPSCGFFSPEEVAAITLAPNAFASRALSRPIYEINVDLNGQMT